MRDRLKYHISQGVLIVLLMCMGSCRYFKKKDRVADEDIVARVYDKTLTASEIIDEMPGKLKAKDSVHFVNSFVENWVKQSVILHQAEKNLSAEQLNVENQLEKYRNSLVTYAFEQELIRQKLDTQVTAGEIEAYYLKNPQNFELKDNIIRVIYVKVKKNAPKLNKLREWYKSEKESDKKLLEDYCRQFADNYYLDDESWLLFDDLLKEIPIETYNKEEYLKNNRFVEFTTATDVYFVNIKGFKIKDSLSPLSFEKENIKSVILNKRKLSIINAMRKDVYDEALKKNEIELKKGFKIK